MMFEYNLLSGHHTVNDVLLLSNNNTINAFTFLCCTVLVSCQQLVYLRQIFVYQYYNCIQF